MEKQSRLQYGLLFGKLPYPYKAMIAICSDLDETESADVYFKTSQFLNASGNTAFGNGLNLEVGNTMYFDMPADQFSYWNMTNYDRGRIRELIRAGFIDCFHSFGDTATSRSQAQRILEHLDAEKCYLKVWVDHATAPSNLGQDIMQGRGDLEGSEIYHSDLTLDYGVKYAWLGRVTSIPGQNQKRDFRVLFDKRAITRSLRTLCTETAKVSLGLVGHPKYQIHAKNRLLRNVRLRDGRTIVEFVRTNPNPRGVSVGDTAAGIGQALRSDVLDSLVRRKATAVFYTHLGKDIHPVQGFTPESREALVTLAARYHAGEILVTSTKRLLDYVRLSSQVRWKAFSCGDVLRVDLSNISEDIPLDGLNFEIESSKPVRVFRGNKEVPVKEVLSQANGRRFIMVPWVRMLYDA